MPITEEQKAAIVPELYRSEDEAAHCGHLNFGPLARTTETLRLVRTVPKVSPLLLPHEMPPQPEEKFVPVTMWPNFPTVSFTCVAPEMVEWARNIVPPEVRSAINSLETTLAHCRCCPFWKQREATA